MIIHLSDAVCIDGSLTNEPRSLYLIDGVVAHALGPNQRADAEYRVSGCAVFAGGVDIHTHIGGGKVNLARLLLPERQRPVDQHRDQDPSQAIALSCPVPNTEETGRRYLQMGYTTCIEPAMLPAGARHAHMEMHDIPWLDTGGLVLLGNERLLLRSIAEGRPLSQIADYVAWMVKSHAALGIKVVNAGGIDAFKYNQRQMDLDTLHPCFPVTPRKILRTLAHAIRELDLAHPVHVHCSNLGMPGNIESTLATIDAVEGERIHLAHAQFHCYGTDGPHGFASAADRLAERVNASNAITLDVGQVLFGQTVTLSADTMHQFANRKHAMPRKFAFQDLECQAGCGVLPFRYRESQYVHSLQWSIGLELFLRVADPWKIFLTTDHPNGAPFTSYPHLIRLLMDYDFRMSIFERLHPDVRTSSPLPSLKREYTLEEIAVITRAGPARALGMLDRGHLRAGAVGDVAVYPLDPNREAMFSNPKMVFRRGRLVYRDGEWLDICEKATLLATLGDEERAEVWVSHTKNQDEWKRQYGYSPSRIAIGRDELHWEGHGVGYNVSASEQNRS